MNIGEAFAAAVRAQLDEATVKAELAKLELSVIGGLEFLENLLLRAGETAIELAIPAVLRPFLVPIVEPLMDKGITALENLTDEEARKLLPVTAHVAVGSQTFALTVAKVFPPDLPQGPEETVADWPSERNK